ncbi:MAG TPA: DUF4307 domain-containing protein [Pilimelia sp.]|nr:DUF4307 domain-containing protein [Pilimelia sp.]
MTETRATLPAFPPGRYGRRRAQRPPSRAGAAVALVAVLAAAVLLAVLLYQRYGDPAYEAQVVSYTGITDDGLDLTFRVTMPAAGRGAVCAVRARSHAGAVVGRAEVTVPPGERETTYRLATTERPFIGEVLRCRPAG